MGWWASAAAIVSGLLLLAFPAAAELPVNTKKVSATTPTLNDAEVVRWIIDGRYDHLAGLKARGETGDPVALYWWGRLIFECAVDPCSETESVIWWRRAALAGDERARAQMFLLGDVSTSELGPPRSEIERMALALRSFAPTALTGEKDKSTNIPNWQQFIADVHAEERPSMQAYALASSFSGATVDIEVLQAMVRAGFPSPGVMPEQLLRRWMLNGKIRSLEDLLSQVQSGDPVAATVLCEVGAFAYGLDRLPDNLLPHCIAQLGHGQLGMVSVLLSHSIAAEEWEKASAYAKLCESLMLGCSQLSDYYSHTLGNGPAWQEEDALVFVANGGVWLQVMAPNPKLRPALRKGLSRKIAREEVKRLCMQRRYDRVTKEFESLEGCPWGRENSLPKLWSGARPAHGTALAPPALLPPNKLAAPNQS